MTVVNTAQRESIMSTVVAGKPIADTGEAMASLLLSDNLITDKQLLEHFMVQLPA